MANWKPGDPAIIDFSGWPTTDAERRAQGHTCTLLEFVGNHYNHQRRTVIHHAWRIQLDSHTAIVDEQYLRKPPDDEDEASWDAIEKLCDWHPAEPVTVPISEPQEHE